MKVTVKGSIRDLLAFRGLAGKRKKRIGRASSHAIPGDSEGALARQLHPDLQHFIVADIRDETPSTKTFRLAPDPQGAATGAALFRAGQYVSVKANVEGFSVSRPYSICSAPYEALGDGGYYEITVRRQDGGFMTRHIWDAWDVGSEVTTSGPAGTFYYEPLRDQPKILGLAGGSGITPFRSMAREIVNGTLDVDLNLLYGSSAEDDIIYYDELQALEAESGGRVRATHVLSCEEVNLAGCEQGFISAETIRRHADVGECSVFVCGPQAMYRYMAEQLATFGLPPRRIRREAYGEVDDVSAEPGFPAGLASSTFTVRVHMGGSQERIPARACETVLVALERAKMGPPSQCRSGECGYCRSLLLSGDVYIVEDTDGRREADKEFGYIHPCATYPLSDLEIRTPRAV